MKSSSTKRTNARNCAFSRVSIFHHIWTPTSGQRTCGRYIYALVTSNSKWSYTKIGRMDVSERYIREHAWELSTGCARVSHSTTDWNDKSGHQFEKLHGLVRSKPYDNIDPHKQVPRMVHRTEWLPLTSLMSKPETYPIPQRPDLKNATHLW